VEGIPGWLIIGVLLIYLALAVFGITSIVALGLSIAGRTRAALILFASGLLFLSFVTGFVPLMAFMDAINDPNSQLKLADEALFGMVALGLFLAGTGQFIAAIRKPRSYLAVFRCMIGSLLFLGCAAFAEADFFARLLGDFNRFIPEKKLPLAMASLLLAVAGLIIAVLPQKAARAN
jgi:hypothetical protein